MTREKSSPSYQVAILATGDEICNGDIFNSNSQQIANRLFNAGIQPGIHMSVSDNLTDLETAMHFLLKNHDALIITGGLGPTSDDLTCKALGNVLQRPLVFDEPTWQYIVERLNRFGITPPPESNRQQALFPQDATIIPNVNGTAAGCMATRMHNGHEQFIFMLPGPPMECLPLFDNTVLPTLINNDFKKIFHYEKWLLFNISEAVIAEQLDKIAQPFDCVTGYRFWYPYIECKLYSNNETDFAAVLPLVQNAIAPYVMDDGKSTALELLKRELVHLNEKLTIQDFVTGGLLESVLKTPETLPHLDFSYETNDTASKLRVSITGLEEFWCQDDNHRETTLNFTFMHNGQQHTHNAPIPYRGYRVKQYAVEFICWQVCTFLRSIK